MFQCYPSSEKLNAKEAGTGLVEEQDSAGFEKERDLNAKQKVHVQGPTEGADMSLSTGEAGDRKHSEWIKEGAVSEDE